MRIAEINDVASVASELGEGLRRRGHEVTLIRPKAPGAKLPQLLKPVTVPARAIEWAKVIRQVRGGNFDVVHIHYATLGIVGELGRFPYVLHCHGTDVRDPDPVTRPIVQRVLRNAVHVFYATPDLAEPVLRHRPDAEFLPNPIDTETFRPLTPARECRDVFIGCWLTAVKGAPKLLEACRMLAEQRPDIRITAIDSGPFSAQFAALPNVTLLARQPRAKLPSIFARHGVVMGQMHLGIAGMLELEAMACGRPVVTPFAFNHVYPEPGPFVLASTPEQMAADVIRLVDDADLREMIGRASRAWVARHHQIDAIAGRFEERLKEIAQRTPNQRRKAGH